MCTSVLSRDRKNKQNNGGHYANKQKKSTYPEPLRGPNKQSLSTNEKFDDNVVVAVLSYTSQRRIGEEIQYR